MLKGSLTLEDLGITKNGKLYFKDLGPQIGWTTVRQTTFSVAYGMRGEMCKLTVHLIYTLFIHINIIPI